MPKLAGFGAQGAPGGDGGRQGASGGIRGHHQGARGAVSGPPRDGATGPTRQQSPVALPPAASLRRGGKGQPAAKARPARMASWNLLGRGR